MTRVLTAAFLVALTLGCDQPERLGGAAPLDPRAVATLARFEPLELDPMVLDTHADYDRWEQAVIARGGPRLAYSIYSGALTSRRGTPRTLERWVWLCYRESLPDEFREPLRPFIQALAEREDARTNPDIQFLVGAIAWDRLIGGAGRPDVPRLDNNLALIDTVKTSWGALVESRPGWRGPNGLTGAILSARLASLIPPDRAIPQPPPQGAPPEALAAFHSRWADKGPKQACDPLDTVMAGLPPKDPGAIASVGDAYAFCAFERKNPAAALTHLQRMAEFRVDGAYGSILARAGGLAQSDPTLAAPLEAARQAVDTAARADSAFAARNRLTARAP